MDTNSLAHTKWNCKYHIAFAPKHRRRIIYGKLRPDQISMKELIDPFAGEPVIGGKK